MAMKKRIPTGRYSVTTNYIVTRGKALTFPYKQFFQKEKPTKDTVYGCVIDMPINPQILTSMVCYINGAANLYFNTGGDYSGAAQRYPGVVQAARTLVLSASQFVEKCEKVTSFDLPTSRVHAIYLLTPGGTYKMEIDPSAIPAEDQDKRLMFNLYQRVMGELRIAQMKDQANNK